MSATLSPPPKASSHERTPFTAQLSAVGRVLQREQGASLFLRGVPWVLGLVLAALVADVVLHFGANVRVGIDLLLGVGLLGLFACCGWIAWVRRPAFEHTARVLESRDARLGSKLINLLQLRDQENDASLTPMTRQLAGLAIGTYSEELRGVDLNKAARTDAVRRDAKRTGWALLAFAAVLVLGIQITKVELPRFLDPFGDHPPYSFTRIEIVDPGADGAEVTYHATFLVAAQTKGHRPGELFLSWFPVGQPEAVVTLPMFDKGERGFAQQIEGIESDIIVIAHTKNRHSLSKQRRIAVELTPKLEKIFVKTVPPAYTGLKSDEHPLALKNLKALAGTELTFRVQSNRPLREGRIVLVRGPGDTEKFPMKPTLENEVAGTFTAKESGRLVFTLIDRDGHPSVEKWECALQVTHDLGPDVQITNPNSDTFVAMDFKVEPLIEANDDYGIKTLRIHQAKNDVYGEPRVIHYDTVTRNPRESFTLDLATMNLASGDTITLFAEAIDTAPEPHLARSKTVTLTVITVEEYNQFLRERTDMADIEQKYSDLLNKLHDLVEEQRKVSEEIAALQKQLEKTPSEAAQKKIDELTARQNELNARLNKLADNMDKFVRDQPLYDLESELQKVLSEKAQEIRESTKQNDAAMKDLVQAQGQQKPDPAMLSGMKKASDDQLAKLGGAEQEAREEIIEPVEDLALLQEIMKDLNRVEELANAQKELAAQAKAYDRPGPLTREDQLALKDLAAQQKEIGEALAEVEDKLWEDGKAAKEKFPKAAESAQNIAQAIGDLNLQRHAGNATKAMLEGRGEQSAQLSQQVSNELESLFGQCKGQQGEMSDELDGYLKLTRGLKPGNNFKQMMQCKKFGNGKESGSGRGESGQGGFAVKDGQQSNVMGNETSISNPESKRAGSSGQSRMKYDQPPAPAAVEKTDVVQGMKPADRASDAVQSESVIDRYSDLVEKYFKAITK